MNQIGKIKKVPIREIWKREDTHFSKWLSENIDYLNDVINLDITIQSVEEPVGPYRVDVYAEDQNGNKIIIENQLEKTDHSHLGQLLTYMVNLDAKTAIWISTNPVDEHTRVIEWLNETTPHDMFFYLIRVEAIQIEGQSMVAPLFTVVEGPTQELKKIGIEKKEYAERHFKRKEFWGQFLDYSNQHTDLTKNLNPKPDSWLGIGLGFGGVSVNCTVSNKYARTEVYINRGSHEENKRVFDVFTEHKHVIETKFGGSLIWERMEDKITSRIKWQLDGVSVSNENDWPQMNEFMTDGLIRLHEAVKEVVKLMRAG
jgi:hypothetical protein